MIRHPDLTNLALQRKAREEYRARKDLEAAIDAIPDPIPRECDEDHDRPECPDCYIARLEEAIASIRRARKA